MIIYQATNTINGKKYIGKTTKGVPERWGWHLQKVQAGSQTHFHRAIRKHGKDAFTFTIIEENIPIVKLNDREIYHITETAPEYNMTSGGDGGDTSSSPNYIAGMKRRNYRGENNPNYGKRGPLSGKWGKTYGPKPKISEAKKQPVMADGRMFPSVGECEKALSVKWSYSSKKYPTRFYKLRKATTL